MSIFYKLGFTLLLISLNFSAYAAVFKCEENGNITFSDTPCKSSAQDLTHEQLTPPAKTATPADKSRLKKTKQLADKLEASRIKREIQRDIISLESEIEDINKSRDEELLALNKIKDSIGDDGEYDDEELTAADLRKNINDKINEATNKYTAKIEEANKKISDLRSQLNAYKK